MYLDWGRLVAGDNALIRINQLNKSYANGFVALKDVDLHIRSGEIFALLGPNGAGKTSLISIICGLNNLTSGEVTVDGFDIVKDYRKTRGLIGLVPQELTTDAFETVWDTVRFSRGLFGLAANDAYIEKLLKDLSLWDKAKNKMMTLSGGMKRRVMIAKALSHEPRVLFLDEPTAGVDVELRKGMWQLVRELNRTGVTIILTTHYIEEAEEMADRVGVINRGQIEVVEQTQNLMQKMGKKQLAVELIESTADLPASLQRFDLKVEGTHLLYDYDSRTENNGVCDLFQTLNAESIRYRDIITKQSSLEEIFVELVQQK